MTTDGDRSPRAVVTVTFPADGAEPRFELGAANITDLAAASWWLNRLATEARTGQVMAMQIEAQQRQALAAGLRNGGRG